MATWTALTTLPGREPAEALGAAMEGMTPPPNGVGVFEMEDGSGLWEVGGYFDGPPDAAALALLAAAFGARPFAVSELPETDWVAKVRRELAPVQAGRFWLHGAHDAHRVPEGVEPLLVEAAMAFGTGHHGTTLGCLRAFDRLVARGEAPGPVADLGCGTAVLAMAAARVWPEVPIYASDIDAVAVEVAEANVAANGLAGRVRVLEAAGLAHPELRSAPAFRLVFANILKGPLIELVPDVSAAIAPGGWAILSGLLAEQRDEVTQAWEAAGLTVDGADEIAGWATLCLRKS
ncbi:MAG: 50S ribosomal protein L11 methyltransferase [Paracoccaceae bacterium]|jgi:ribosomal protein L11 methyltransferase|nr:50S ribosomal protein L11 methyltransferase [Paracoccaceae bacterium]